MPSNKIVINNHLKFEIPNSKMDNLMDYLYKNCMGAENSPVKAGVKPEIAEIIKEAFLLGEQWGITYSTWFTPTLEQHKEEIDKATKYVKKKFEL